MKRQIVLIASLVAGVLAALLTRFYIAAKDAEIRKIRESFRDRYGTMFVVCFKRDVPGGTVLSKADLQLKEVPRVGVEGHAVSESDGRPGGIADIESCFLQRENAPAHENSGEVTVITANDPYDEANFVACKIIELVRNENLRWRDMAVIARDLTPYIHALPVAFEKAGIPMPDPREKEE